MPIARKNYRCFICGEEIGKGELYQRIKVQTYSEQDNKISLADICTHDGCYYDDAFDVWKLIGEELKDGRKIIDIVKAPDKW